MMKYQQLTLEERVLISHLVKQGFNLSEIARQMDAIAALSHVKSGMAAATASIIASATREHIAAPLPGGDNRPAAAIREIVYERLKTA